MITATKILNSKPETPIIYVTKVKKVINVVEAILKATFVIFIVSVIVATRNLVFGV